MKLLEETYCKLVCLATSIQQKFTSHSAFLRIKNKIRHKYIRFKYNKFSKTVAYNYFRLGDLVLGSRYVHLKRVDAYRDGYYADHFPKHCRLSSWDFEGLIDAVKRGWLLLAKRPPEAVSVSCGEILVPTFVIGANPTINLSQIKTKRFYIVDRAQLDYDKKHESIFEGYFR